MRTFNKISYCSATPSVVALGCFDGVHLGHASVIRRAVEIAKKLSLPCIVFTFDEPPKSLFSSVPTPLITSPEKKTKLISELGADILVSVPFTMDIARLSPIEFAKKILEHNLNASHIVCGADYTFGSMAKGNTKLSSKTFIFDNLGGHRVRATEKRCGTLRISVGNKLSDKRRAYAIPVDLKLRHYRKTDLTFIAEIS